MKYFNYLLLFFLGVTLSECEIKKDRFRALESAILENRIDIDTTMIVNNRDTTFEYKVLIKE